MRSLATLGLLVLSTLPLAAHDHGPWACRTPRRVVVVEPRPYAYGWVERDHWADRDRCEDRWERRPRRWFRRDWDDGDDVVVMRPLPRPLTRPWQARVEFRFGR